MKRLIAVAILTLPWIVGSTPSGNTGPEHWAQQGVKVLRAGDGLIRRMSGPITPPSAEPPDLVARDFVSTYGRSLSGGSSFDLTPISSFRGPSGTQFSYAITLNGIPVYESGLMVHVTDGGDIDEVTVVPAAGIAARSRPVVDAAVAEDAPRRFLSSLYRISDVPVRSSLSYIEVDHRLRLCWQMQAQAREGAWSFLVSAEEPGMTYAVQRYALDELTGRGSVYQENPRRTKNPVTVDLPHLDSSKTLKGTWARTYNANGQETFTDGSQMARFTTAGNQNNVYAYSTSDRRFTEVMGYYHVTRMHDYLKDNQLTNAVNGMMPIVVNVQDSEDPSKGFDNAFFTRDWRFSSTGILVFGSGNELHNFAEDSDVLYHEYGHAVLDRIQRGLIQNFEHVYSGAIHEGTGDSIAAHLNGNSKLAEWALSYRGSGKFVGRNVDNTNMYPDDVRDPDFGQAEVHYTGQIVGGLFWSMRKALGPETAIKLYFGALNRLGPKADFFDLRDDLLLTEKALEKNVNLTMLNQLIAARGLDGDDPGNSKATAVIQSLQTRHFDWDTFEVGGRAESFAPGTWVALMATVNVTDASPGYNMIPVLKLIFPPDVGSGGYEAYYLINEEQPGRYEYPMGLLYSPDYAVPATLTWKVKTRLGDQSTYTAEKSDTFKIQ